ncbi:acetylajmalan esterase-like [Phalaenopsis equestris]|uniref:acetylajmalan esterase-like n=1 Tax=Phalaenopsis equestris TaxID=78828 RepID=UPI0009E4AE2F|nr:acetylajmalan esterase-like [Phalaenopsis equestris]
MASSSSSSLFCYLFLSVLSVSSALASNPGGGCFINAIYSFGDSIADTGNLLRMGPGGVFNPIGHLPYGLSMKKRTPTGRCSDGLLIIDYLAMALNLSLINPYMDKTSKFDDGVNFAVAGATALDVPFFMSNDVIMPYAASSIGIQLSWFNTHLSSVCSTREECSKKLERTLFLLGEIGGNDYSFAFYQGKSIEDVATFVPQVVQLIVDAVKHVIEAGAVHIIVPGNFPIGCFPSFLVNYKGKGAKVYDRNNCIKELNTFSQVHNKKLQKALESLGEAYPHANILYSDYYQAFMNLIDKASILGFDESSLLKSCCGGGGQYNFDINMICGMPGAWPCSDPSKYISWDGIHLTQAAYKNMAQALIDKFIFPTSKFQKIWKC